MNTALFASVVLLCLCQAFFAIYATIYANYWRKNGVRIARAEVSQELHDMEVHDGLQEAKIMSMEQEIELLQSFQEEALSILDASQEASQQVE